MKIILFILLYGAGNFYTAYNAVKHPFHVSNTEINYNAVDKNLEISCKIFTDDFESALEKTYKQKADFSNKSMESQMEKLVKQYMKDHLAIHVDKKQMLLTYIGYEVDREAVNIYLESPYINFPKTVIVQNTLNYEVYDDQISIIHVIVNGKRNTKKITFPAKLETFNF